MNVAVKKPNGLPRSIRLIKSTEFGAVLSANKTKLIRSYSDFFSVSALKTDNVGCIRFGFTVGKQNAHLSVERVMVKRLLREKARQSRLILLNALEGRKYGLDINFRLKRKLPVCSLNGLSKKARKKMIQSDIDRLFDYFVSKVSYQRAGDAEFVKNSDCCH